MPDLRAEDNHAAPSHLRPKRAGLFELLSVRQAARGAAAGNGVWAATTDAGTETDGRRAVVGYGIRRAEFRLVPRHPRRQSAAQHATAGSLDSAPGTVVRRTRSEAVLARIRCGQLPAPSELIPNRSFSTF